jgi:hypothetical protein
MPTTKRGGEEGEEVLIRTSVSNVHPAASIANKINLVFIVGPR